MKKFFALFLCLSSGVALAQDNVDCSFESVIKGIGPATATIKCKNGSSGFVRNETKVSSVRIMIIDKNGMKKYKTLKNPPGGIRSLYALRYNDWVVKQLSMSYGDEIQVAENGIKISGDTILYDDYQAKKPLGKASQKPITKMQCNYMDQGPVVVEFKKSCKKNICVANVKCSIPNKPQYVGRVVCATVKGNNCPTADECAKDKDVTMYYPDNEKTLKVLDSKTGNAKNR